MTAFHMRGLELAFNSAYAHRGRLRMPDQQMGSTAILLPRAPSLEGSARNSRDLINNRTGTAWASPSNFRL